MTRRRPEVDDEGPLVPPEGGPTRIEARSWRSVADYVHGEWLPDTSPHHAVVAQTRAGKSTLIRHGILPLVAHDRVLILDSKGGNDATWAGCGRPVSRFPSKLLRRARENDEPREHWYRLVIPLEHTAGRTAVRGREVVADALDKVIREGQWVVVVDETRHITDATNPGLNLRGPYEQLLLRGGSHGVMVISGTQAPRWVPSSFYDSAGFAWFGHLRDRVAHKRILEVGGMSRDLLPEVEATPRYSWLLNADGGHYLARVKGPRKS